MALDIKSGHDLTDETGPYRGLKHLSIEGSLPTSCCCQPGKHCLHDSWLDFLRDGGRSHGLNVLSKVSEAGLDKRSTHFG